MGSHSRRYRWLSSKTTNRRRSATRQRAVVPFSRPLRFEPLEDRRLLAGVVVGNNLDLVNGDTNTIANLIADDGGDGISLREALLAANGTAGADEVTFAAALSGQTIALGGMDLVIAEALTIDARPLDENVTITANQQSRIFNITATTGDFMLGGLSLTGGRTTGHNATPSTTTFSGGAIRSVTSGQLVLEQSHVISNSTAGLSAFGGGIWANGSVTLNNSIVSGNRTSGLNAHGGGIFSNSDVALTDSTVRDNSTAGDVAGGGGIFAQGSVTLTASSVNGNSTSGINSIGGGIRAGRTFPFSSVTLTESTVSGNRTAGNGSHGGGIYAFHGVLIVRSTVADNHAMNAAAMGGGVFQYDSSSNYSFTITGSIVATNTAGGSGADVVTDPLSALTVNYSLIGVADGLTFAGNVGNRTGTVAMPLDPRLGPLADNGGPTMTHALLVGSPAIDSGDPGAIAGLNGVPFYDQRDEPFDRIRDGNAAEDIAIDMGAFEVQQFVPGPELPGDYNQNGIVDAADYTTWRDTLGQSGLVPYSGADGSGDGTIGPEDYQVWKDHFGQTVPTPGAANGERGAGSGEQDVAGGGQSPFSAALTVNQTLETKMGTDPDASAAAAPLASAATPTDGQKAEGGRGKAEQTLLGRLPNSSDGVAQNSSPLIREQRRPAAATWFTTGAERDAGLLAWLAARVGARRPNDGADVDDEVADRAGDAGDVLPLDSINDAFDSLLADAL